MFLASSFYFYLQKSIPYGYLGPQYKLHMQVQSSKLHISNISIQQPEYEKIIPISCLTEIQSTNKAQILQLKIPMISILYGYKAGQQSKGYEYEMDVDFMAKGDKIPRKQLVYKKSQNYLYKLIEIDSCLCYEKPITTVITIKVSQKSQGKQLGNINDLVSQLSNRSFIIYNEKSLVTYRRDFIIKQPLSLTHRYVSVSSSAAYILLKCKNSREEPIQLLAVRLMNWSVKINQEVRVFESKSSFDQLSKSGMEVKGEEEVVVMLSMCSNLKKIEIPCVLQLSVGGYPKHRFKMIKYLLLE